MLSRQWVCYVMRSPRNVNVTKLSQQALHVVQQRLIFIKVTHTSSFTINYDEYLFKGTRSQLIQSSSRISGKLLYSNRTPLFICCRK